MNEPREVLELLVSRLVNEIGPVEAVIAEWRGSAANAVATLGHSEPQHRASAVASELRQVWGLTGDPSWVDGVVPGRPSDDDELEHDVFFALFRRPDVFAYVRLRTDSHSTPTYTRLILGAVRHQATTVA